MSDQILLVLNHTALTPISASDIPRCLLTALNICSTAHFSFLPIPLKLLCNISQLLVSKILLKLNLSHPSLKSMPIMGWRLKPQGCNWGFLPGLPALDTSLNWYILPREKWASVRHTCVTQLVGRKERHLRKQKKGWETQNSGQLWRQEFQKRKKPRDMR